MILYIDLINKCNLRCRTCPRGTGNMHSSNEYMSLELFKKIVEKSRKEQFDCIGVFNWTEPFLVENLYEYMEVIKQSNLTSWLSSNLSIPNIKNLEKTLCSGVDSLFVTVSGHDNNTHQINHVGSDINIVYDNLKKAAKIKQDNQLNMQIVLRMLDFPYNKHSAVDLAKFAKSIGIEFCTISSYGDPTLNILDKAICSQSTANEPFSIPLGKVTRRGKCQLIHDNLPLDHRGNAYLCCGMENKEKLLIGNYLDMDFGEIFAHRMIHPECRKCAINFGALELSPTEKNYIVSIFEKDGTVKSEHRDIERLKSQISSLESDLANVSAQSNQYLIDYNNIVNSRSWKLTKPYRKIGSIIRRTLGL